ncbi:MAG: phenylphosphate carboxylase subunit delta [Desulfobacterales bacterium]|nr:MAG: phenylphosphate carboxylase subunit delta [Desulfobacterales bacterium]
MDRRLTTQLKQICLLLLDVDGVLTDGTITYTDGGEQVKSFNSKDGLGMRLLMDAGVDIGIVTGRTSGALRHRCSDLGIHLIFEGVTDKAAAFNTIVNTTQLAPEQIAFMGDDLIDLPAMTRAGLSFTVADAPDEIKQVADLTSKLPGGRGAVRQICEILLKARGDWDNIIAGFMS